jgi:hypothetical protein
MSQMQTLELAAVYLFQQNIGYTGSTPLECYLVCQRNFGEPYQQKSFQIAGKKNLIQLQKLTATHYYQFGHKPFTFAPTNFDSYKYKPIYHIFNPFQY